MVNSPAVASALVDALSSFWRRGRSVERTSYAIGLLLVIWGSLALAALTIGGGSWEGPLSLRKAGTFGLSFGLTLITVAWVSSWLRLGDRSRPRLLGAFAAACVVEVALVSLQVWRGVPSHYNVETPFDASIARTLAAGGVVLVLVIAWLTVSAFRRQPQLPNSLRVAIRTGLALLSASLVVGAAMIAKGMTLVFAGHPQAAYTTGGALKATHGVTMHAVLVLPVLAWLLSFVRWPEPQRLRVVQLASAGYLTVAASVAAENIAGLAPSNTPLALLMLSALGLLTLLAAIALTLAGLARAFTPDGLGHA